MDEFKITEYTEFLTNLAQVMKNLKEIKTKTNSALDTINTNFDLTEAMVNVETPDTSEVILSAIIPGYAVINSGIKAKKAVDNQKSNNQKIKNSINDAKKKLAELDKWISSDFAKKFTDEINYMLESIGLTKDEINRVFAGLGGSVVPLSSSAYSYDDIQSKTKNKEIDINTHGSYTSMTFDTIIFGDAAENQTSMGTGVNIVLQFIPGVDTVLDVRDLIADGYLWCAKSGDYSTDEKIELGAFTGLDVVGFIPVVGVLKYSDEIADIAKSGKNIGKARDTVKSMEKVTGIEKTTGKFKYVENSTNIVKKKNFDFDDTTKSIKANTNDIIKKVESNEIELKTKKQKGNFGEMKMDQHFEDNRNYRRLGESDKRISSLDDNIHNGIDGVYENASPPPKYIIADAKYNTSKLNPKTHDGPQMSRSWILGSKRLEKAVGTIDARKIKRELLTNPENVQRMVVQVMPDGKVIEKILK